MNAEARVTCAQAIVRFLQAQYSELDSKKERLIAGVFGIFGHGNVAGFGQALEEFGTDLRFFQAKNEQSMVHAAIGYAKAKQRRSTLACTASIGPGSTNMLTGAATATINRVPVLLFPSDIFAHRKPGNVLQQIEHPLEADVSVNDAFRPLSRFFDRISRPEQILDSLPEAMRIMTDSAETGAVSISLPQDVQGESFLCPTAFFDERIWTIRRPAPAAEEVAAAAKLLAAAKRPMIIAGGGVRYSDASAALVDFADTFGIPVSETHAGKGVALGAVLHLGGQGLNGTGAAAHIAENADVVICIGTRLSDFNTASRSLFQNASVKFIGINVNARDAYKLSACPVVADAKRALEALKPALAKANFKTDATYQRETRERIDAWTKRYNESVAYQPGTPMQQSTIFSLLNQAAKPGDAIVAAAGSPPGELQRGWDVSCGADLFLEFGFSCMGHEIPAGLGVRLARPNRGEVYVVVGDGTYLMSPTELVTAAQEGLRITVVLIDNWGFQCIRDLQEATTGSSNYGNELRRRTPGATQPDGEYVNVDYAANAASMGCDTFNADTPDEFRKALDAAKTSTKPVVIVAKADPRSKPINAGLWWDLGVAEVSGLKGVKAAFEQHSAGRKKQKTFI
jgi:3D-(3,5/4)-trihydroxycyclohexane-1,2-dione acylhydrolase (decyclizing)